MIEPTRAEPPIKPARVDFDGHRPVSLDFGDVYYDADGPAEVERVFLGPAALAQRSRESTSTFTVGELGFGTGLNFIVTAAATRSRLHYVSFERYPLARAHVARALSPWKASYPMADALTDAYPPLVSGWHRRVFEDGRIGLSVFYGDVHEGMTDLAHQQQRGVDAWFLDGFAPRRNPEMWQAALFRNMAGLSAPGATVTTFTAAGQVRRDLAAAGFQTRRVDQRPHKRHSTVGVYDCPGRTFKAPSQVTVYGGGLAGAATARALVERGIGATLVHRGIASGASAIPAAVLHPRLSPHASAESRLRAHAYLFAAHRCRNRPGTTPSGVLQLPSAKIEVERLRMIAQTVPEEVAVFVDATRASELAGIDIATPALFFPEALAIDGAGLTADLATHPHIELTTSAPTGDEPTVYATGDAIDGFDWLEVTGLEGQVDRFGCNAAPRLPLIGDGVIVPAREGVWVGATYEYRRWKPERATAANAVRFENMLGWPPGSSLERFRGVRAATSDHLPVVGQWEGAAFNLGHGSHGTSTAILGAEIVASSLNGEVGPVTAELLAILGPKRFRERQQRRPNPFTGANRATPLVAPSRSSSA